MALTLRARTAIAATLEQCWERFADIDGVLERVPHDRIEIVRTVGAGPVQPGATWRVGLSLAGRGHRGRLSVAEVAPPHLCRFEGGTDAIGLTLRIAMNAEGPDRTALAVTADAAPRTLSGRVVLKPLQVMRPAIEARFQARVEWVVAQMMDGQGAR